MPARSSLALVPLPALRLPPAGLPTPVMPQPEDWLCERDVDPFADDVLSAAELAELQATAEDNRDLI